MARARRKSEDPIEFAAQLFGLGLMLALLFVGARSASTLIGIAVLLFVLMVVGGVTAFLFIRYLARKANPFNGNHPSPRLAVAVPQVDLHAPSQRLPQPVPVSSRPGKLSLMHQLETIDWFQFEKVVALAYRRQGWSVSRRGGANPDGGIDMTACKEGETLAIQCKHWKKWKVKLGTVRDFLGAMVDAQIQRGQIITLCGSTFAALDFAAKHNIQILDATALVAKLQALNLQHDPELQALLIDTRKVCPRCEHEMVLRTPRGGGNQFWGCSTYPRCHYKMPAQ